ncbi:MAG: DUF445 domain-containing protein [Bacteriovoracaceae bacterium]|nr:DUF445 domain-containing protein [Bacteriovoracaceae bacterium]
MNKSILTNLLSILLIVGGYFSPIYRDQILAVGVFAFSGAITNWLAIHMLFEKVPGLYGSGVVPNNFGKFKAGIRYMIMEQFFTKENINKFLSSYSQGHEMDLTPLLKKIDSNSLFEELIKTVMESPLGGMLSMFGGAGALESLRVPFTEKIELKIEEIAKSDAVQSAVKEMISSKDTAHQLIEQVDHIVHQRLEELTPQMVKEIIQRMIKEHLGWLVVWGGVFGGLIGLGMSFLQ